MCIRDSVDADHQIAVYTDHQIFDRYQRFKAKNAFAKSEQLTLKDLMQMKVGDYITPVSYTHLDVYKRQVVHWLIRVLKLQKAR